MKKTYRLLAVACMVIVICTAANTQAADDKEGIAFFNKKILPVLKKHCYECHSSQSSEYKGNLRIDTREGIREGGDNGEAVVPGKVDEGFLLPVLRYEEDDYQMPPTGKLSDKVIADIQKWIKMGAPDPRTEKK